MDAKAIKATLKSAREAIREKDYKEALRHCKAILKADKNNYNALVFVGVAAEGLEQPEQALVAFKKATEINSDHLLGWQGLCGFYEKTNNPEYSENLIFVYTKLIELQKSDVAKCNQIRKKLVQLLELKGESQKCLELYHTLLNDVHDEAERRELLCCYVQFAQASKDLLNEEQKEKLLSVYKEVVDKDADVNTWMEYLKLLIKFKVLPIRISLAAKSFSECHPDASYPVELQARILLDLAIDDISKYVDDLSQILSHLKSVKPESGYALLINGAQNFEYANWKDAKVQLSQGVNKVKSSIGGWYFLSHVTLKTHDKHQLFKAVTQGVHLLTTGSVCYCDATTVLGCFQKWLAEACIQLGDEKHLDEAKNVIEKLLEADKDADDLCILQAKIYLALNQVDHALQVLERVKDKKAQIYLALKGWLHHLMDSDEQAKTYLNAALSVSEGCSMTHYYMGRVLFDEKSPNSDTFKLCLTHLLKAAKLDPFYSKVFLYLGYYYGKILKDINKSAKCFQKAYDLDPDSDEVGSALIDGLLASGEENKALHVLKDVTSHAKAGSAKWAWLRLGLYHLKHQDPTGAIISLQNALRADTKDFHCWECLGEAYMKRGSYTAALKAFTRATELDNSALFCYYQMATIKQILGSYDEAVTAYQSILETSSYVPALKGLGETYLLMARAALKDFFHGRAVNYCQEALTVLTSAASQRADLSCVWKLLGDGCIMLAPVPEADLCLSVPSKLISQSESEEGKVDINKQELISVGSRCYGMAVNLQPECAALWQDLGISYFYQSKLTDKLRVKTFISKSIQCLQKAVSINPLNYRHWNTLGVMAASDNIHHPGLAQHCFIKSIQVEANNVTAWTNLGVLYLMSDEIKLAHEAFKVAQSLDPSYVACWIGQALVAELVQDDEAMDLFRHTTELGNHVEGALGYGHWVCLIIQHSDHLTPSAFDYAVRRMAAIPAASDALAKYVDRVQDDYVAYNLYGLLLERQGLLSLACRTFSKAVELIEGNSEKEKTDDIRTNYARVLCTSNKARDSVEQYKKLYSLDTVDRLCGLGLASYKCELLRESIEAYQQALSVTKDVSDQSHIHAALGLVAYRMGDTNGAKRALFASSQLDKPSLYGLKALLAIGLLQRDSTLCTAVLQEFEKQPNPDNNITINKLIIAVDSLNRTTHRLGGHLLRAIHSHPDRADLWLEETEFLLNPNINKATTAIVCARKSLTLGKCRTNDNSMDNSRQQVSMQDKTLLLAFSSLGAGEHYSKKTSSALNLAMKCVFVQPDHLEAWFVLLSALYSQQRIAPNPALQSAVLSLTTHLMSKVESALSHAIGSKSRLQSLHVWCVKQYICGLLNGGRAEQAQQFLQQAAWLYDDDLHLQALVGAFNQNFSGLKQLVVKDVTGFTYQLLISLYIANGLSQEAEKAYQSWLSRATSRSERLSCLVQMAYFAFTILMSTEVEKDSAAEDKWKASFRKACDQGLKLDPKCISLWLMQGLIMMGDTKQARSSKRSLHQVLHFSQNQLPHAADLARQQLLMVYTEKGDIDAIKELQESCY